MKILFSDLDGTLVNNGMPTHSKNLEMMNELKKQGYYIAICTGRNIKEFQKDVEAIRFPFDYIVLNNGGHIVNKQYETLFEKTIEKEVGSDILNHTTSIPGMWSYYCDGETTYGYKDGVTVDHSLHNHPIDKDFLDMYKQAKNFQIIAFNQENGDIENAKLCYEYIMNNHNKGVEAYFNLHYVDVVPYGCSKGTGVHQLLEIMNKPIREVYAIGDSFNDLSMFKEVTHAYTFHHADDEIKQAADHHVQYVYEVIEDMLGGKK